MDATLAVMLLVMFGLLAIPVIGYSLKVRDAVRIGRFLRLVACYGMVGIFGFIGTVMVLSTIDRGTVLQAGGAGRALAGPTAGGGPVVQARCPRT